MKACKRVACFSQAQNPPKVNYQLQITCCFCAAVPVFVRNGQELKGSACLGQQTGGNSKITREADCTWCPPH